MEESMKDNKKAIHNKGIPALILMILIFILIRFALLYIGAKLSETRENELIQLKMSALTDIVSDAGAKRASAAKSMNGKLDADMQLMTNMLKAFCTEDSYSGPRFFPDGFVAELRGSRVILPEEAEKYGQQITREIVKKGLETGSGQPVPVLIQNNAEQNDSYFFLFGEIAENFIYVEVMDGSEYAAYLDNYSENIYHTLETADEHFGGITLVVSEEAGNFQILRQFGSIEEAEELLDPQLIEQTIRESAPILSLNEKEYQCTVSVFNEGGSEEETRYILQIIPQVSAREQNVSRTLLVVILIVIILIAVTTYVISAQHRSKAGSTDKEEARHYHPDNVRRRMLMVGILSAVIVFAAAVIVESVGQLYMELRYGRDTLRLFSGQVEKDNREQLGSIAEEERSWYLYYGEEMAALFSDYPALAAPEKLQEYCDILSVDYIMLFDSEGNESACSRDYVGFTLGDAPDDEMYDFRRLLHGVPSIVHEVSADAVTGLERQLIGVKIPASEPGSMHGAMIMALLPEQTDGRNLTSREDRVLSLETARGTICFAADSSSGEILYASSASMLGKTVSECGIPDSSLQDGYMDFTAIGGTAYLVITVREGAHIYYYAVESGTMFGQVVLYGALAALLFALVYALLLVFLLRGYKEKAIEELSEIRTHELPKISSRQTDELDADSFAREDESDGDEKQKDGLLQKLLTFLQWKQKNPHERAGIIIRVGIIVLVLCCLDVLHGKALANESYDTMLGFLLHGDWMRGLNLFSLCSCLMILSIAYLVNICSSLILKLTGILLRGHGETICRLLYSCIKYITILGVLYFCLEYLGFPTSTILAALASVSLAVSLGAQDLIADILAGLAIVFDGSFRVGDVVEINGRRGTVLELGVRATRIRIPVNNILMINNHEIKDILNLSKEYSECVVHFRVSMMDPLSKLEGILNRELPGIGGKESRILYGPYLIGVTELPSAASFGPVVTLSVGAMCEQKNEETVKNYLNRELKLLAEREGINLI